MSEHTDFAAVLQEMIGAASSERTSFDAAICEMLSIDAPTNTIITAPVGLGSYSMLKHQLDEAHAKTFVVDGRYSYVRALALPLHEGGYLIPEELLAADTLVVTEASEMHRYLARLISEIVGDRTMRGQAMPNLKRVVLIFHDERIHESPPVFANPVSQYRNIMISCNVHAADETDQVGQVGQVGLADKIVEIIESGPWPLYDNPMDPAFAAAALKVVLTRDVGVTKAALDDVTVRLRGNPEDDPAAQ